MPYAPERAPVFAGIENVSDVIASQAVEAIKTETGIAPSRATLQLRPIPGVTAAAYKAGQPVPYRLWWEDASGVLQTNRLPFVADHVAMRTAQSDRRRTALEKAQANREAARPMLEGTMAPFEQTIPGEGVDVPPTPRQTFESLPVVAP
jgi:hypothetical protein